MTDFQFDELNARLRGCNVLLQKLVDAHEWCVERMKRIDREQRQRDVQADAHLRLVAGRIAELRAQKAAQRKMDRNSLMDACIRSGIWDEMLSKFKPVNDNAQEG